MSDLKLLVVDDSLTIRAMLEEILERYTEAEIVGMASSAEAALDMVNRLLPDIILLDIRLPGVDGYAFLDAIHDHWHEMHVIVVSSIAIKDSKDCQEAFVHGADACFDKARLVKSARELGALIDEIGAAKIHRNAHLGDAVTLPDPAKFSHALPQVQGNAPAAVPAPPMGTDGPPTLPFSA